MLWRPTPLAGLSAGAGGFADGPEGRGGAGSSRADAVEGGSRSGPRGASWADAPEARRPISGARAARRERTIEGLLRGAADRSPRRRVRPGDAETPRSADS